MSLNSVTRGGSSLVVPPSPDIPARRRRHCVLSKDTTCVAGQDKKAMCMQQPPLWPAVVSPTLEAHWTPACCSSFSCKTTTSPASYPSTPPAGSRPAWHDPKHGQVSGNIGAPVAVAAPVLLRPSQAPGMRRSALSGSVAGGAHPNLPDFRRDFHGRLDRQPPAAPVQHDGQPKHDHNAISGSTLNLVPAREQQAAAGGRESTTVPDAAAPTTAAHGGSPTSGSHIHAASIAKIELKARRNSHSTHLQMHSKRGRIHLYGYKHVHGPGNGAESQDEPRLSELVPAGVVS